MSNDTSTNQSAPLELLWKGLGWSTVGKSLGLVLALLVNVLAARALSVEGAAVFFLGVSVTTGLVVFSQLGMPQTATRLISEWIAAGRPGRARAAVRRTAAVNVAAAAAVALFIALPPGRSILGAAFDEVPLPTVVIPLGLLVFGRSAGEWVAESLRGLHDIRGAVTVSGFGPNLVAVVLLTGGWVAAGRLSPGTALLFVAAGWLLMSVFGADILRRRTRPMDAPSALPHGQVGRIGRAMFITTLTAFALAQLDLWMAGRYLTSVEVARYGVALRTADLIPVPLFIANGVIAPIIAGMYVRGERGELQSLVGRISRWTTAGALLVFVAFLAFGPLLLRTFFGAPYGEAAPVLVVLGVGHLVNVVAGPCALTLMMTGNESTLMRASLASTVVMAVGTSLAAAYFGPLGLAAAAAAVLSAHNLAIWAIARSRTGLRTDALAGWNLRHA